MQNFYDIEIKNSKGNEYLLSSLEDKVILIVNTATKCGFAPQFVELEKLHKKYEEKGLVVLAFPCDQFAHQEPVGNLEMEDVCKINFGVTFPIMEKIDVNGKNTHPIFKYLKNETKGLLGQNIKWNFTKFLISKNAKNILRYSPSTSPKSIEKDIKKFLEEN